MKILVRNSDNRVMYARDDLQFYPFLRGDGWVDYSFSPENSRIEDATLPENWLGGVWSYDAGVWTLVDVARHEVYLEELAEIAAAKAGEPKALIRQQIKALEADQLMPRATREFMLLLSESMATPEQLAVNPGYQAIKAFDLQIKELRDQLA